MQSNQKKFNSTKKLQDFINRKSKSFHANMSFNSSFLNNSETIPFYQNLNQTENSFSLSSFSENNDLGIEDSQCFGYGQKVIVKIQEIYEESQINNKQNNYQYLITDRFDQNNPESIDNISTNCMTKKSIFRNSKNSNLNNSVTEKDLPQNKIFQSKFQQQVLSTIQNQDLSWFKSDNSLPLYYKKSKLGKKAQHVFLKPPLQNHVQKRKLMIIEDQEFQNYPYNSNN